MRQLTPEELRRRNKKVMRELIPLRLVMAAGTFLMMALQEKKGVCRAIKEARKAWKLQIG